MKIVIANELILNLSFHHWTLSLPGATKKEFLPTISMHFQAVLWWVERKIKTRDACLIYAQVNFKLQTPPPHWGEIEPCLTGVGKLDQKCQVFPAVEVFNPFAPMISIQILLSVFYAFIMIVAVRIWC